MSSPAKKHTLIAACGLLATVPVWRVFYFQELFFALLLFAGVFFILLLLACIVAGVWMLYAKAVMYLAAWIVKQGHRALLLLRTRLFEQAPTITQSTGIASAPRHTTFYLFGNSRAACCSRSGTMHRSFAQTPNAPSSICGFY